MVGTRVRQSVMFAHLVPPQRATDPSPVPLRLVKAPVAGHPLPKGEGYDSDASHVTSETFLSQARFHFKVPFPHGINGRVNDQLQDE